MTDTYNVAFNAPAEVDQPPQQFVEIITDHIRRNELPGTYRVELNGNVMDIIGSCMFPTYYEVLDGGILFADKMLVRGWSTAAPSLYGTAKCGDCGSINKFGLPHARDMNGLGLYCRNCHERKNGWPILHPHDILRITDHENPVMVATDDDIEMLTKTAQSIGYKLLEGQVSEMHDTKPFVRNRIIFEGKMYSEPKTPVILEKTGDGTV